MTWTSAAVARLTLAAGAALALGLYLYSSSGAAAQGLKSYDSNSRDFWTKPPPDWFLGDETDQQMGQAPNPGQPLPTPLADLEKALSAIKLPQGFKIGVRVSDIPQARQMAWGDKGTLFVGTFDKGTVHAVAEQGGNAVMVELVETLTDNDVKLLAAYLSRLP